MADASQALGVISKLMEALPPETMQKIESLTPQLEGAKEAIQTAQEVGEFAKDLNLPAGSAGDVLDMATSLTNPSEVADVLGDQEALQAGLESIAASVQQVPQETLVDGAMGMLQELQGSDPKTVAALADVMGGGPMDTLKEAMSSVKNAPAGKKALYMALLSAVVSAIILAWRRHEKTKAAKKGTTQTADSETTPVSKLADTAGHIAVQELAEEEGDEPGEAQEEGKKASFFQKLGAMFGRKKAVVARAEERAEGEEEKAVSKGGGYGVYSENPVLGGCSGPDSSWGGCDNSGSSWGGRSFPDGTWGGNIFDGNFGMLLSRVIYAVLIILIAIVIAYFFIGAALWTWAGIELVTGSGSVEGLANKKPAVLF